MKKVIEKYKKFIFIYSLINCFALVVGLFNLDPSFNVGTEIIHLLGGGSNSSDHLWPFVPFYYTISEGYLSGYGVFKGIFYQYGVAEFLLYMGILLFSLIYKAYIAKPVLKSVSQ